MKMNAPDKTSLRPYRLRNTIQHYSWGGKNESAFIADLFSIQAKPDQAYAELWMGIHPNGPSMVIDPTADTISLTDWIAEKPQNRLSLNRSENFPKGLPYLFKVLSADQALSIQAHPNKQQAEMLHHSDPDHYPDDNHKPEIAIALDHLDALVGFLPADKFQRVLDENPELRGLFRKHNQADPGIKDAALSLLAIWETAPNDIESCITEINDRLRTKDQLTDTESLFIELIQLHGQKDIGLLFLWLLNRISLQAGEAVFLPPGIPHAYLKGNIIECMANSDNVVRLGLTEKFCDAGALKQILSFDDSNDFRVKTKIENHTTEYLSPTDEFRVKRLELEQGASIQISDHSELSLYLVLDGEVNFYWECENESCCAVYRRGDSFIVPANLTAFSIQTKSKSKLYLVDLPA